MSASIHGALILISARQKKRALSAQTQQCWHELTGPRVMSQSLVTPICLLSLAHIILPGWSAANVFFAEHSREAPVLPVELVGDVRGEYVHSGLGLGGRL
jgi:hypothetical protein